MRTTLTMHEVRPGETLAGIAVKYRLSSWRAVAEAPDNIPLLAGQHGRDTFLLPGARIHVPPDARALLVARMQAVPPLRASLQRHFESLEEQYLDQVDALRRGAPDADVPRARELLAPLADHVCAGVMAAHERARVFAQVNSGLGRTHLHDHLDLRHYLGGDAAFVGLNWLLTPRLLELWADMWSTEFWVGRWHGANADRAVEQAAFHLNLVRSQVLQQVDQRLRQAHAQIQGLDRE